MPAMLVARRFSGRRGGGFDVRLALFDFEEALAVFNGLAIFDENLEDSAFGLGLNLIHDFHGLDDADHAVFDGFGSDVGERFTLRRSRPIKCPNHGRLNIGYPGLVLWS